MSIKKRNLHESLIQWIINEAGIGPGVGEIRYVAPETSGTSQYRTQLEHMGISSGSIFTLPSLGFAALEANRNDVLLLSPGTYSETATLSWSKAQTHMLGTGNPTWRQGGKIRIQTTTDGVVATVDVTASGVHFGGFNITQNGANAANLTPLRLSSTYFGAKQLDLRGHLVSEVAGVTAASSLEFADGSSWGFGSTFEDCNIGTASGAVRTAADASTSGVINFEVGTSKGSPAAYAEFIDCRILSWAETAGTAMVRLESSFAADRYLRFRDCFFFNFWTNKSNQLDSCFYSVQTQIGSSYVVLDGNCTLIGVDEWQQQDIAGRIFATMPIVGTGGGIGLIPDGTAGN